VVLTPAEAESLDDWGFSNRIRSRSEMIRRLMKVGLETLTQASHPAGKAKPSSERG
jgi:hypothetical protein